MINTWLMQRARVCQEQPWELQAHDTPWAGSCPDTELCQSVSPACAVLHVLSCKGMACHLHWVLRPSCQQAPVPGRARGEDTTESFPCPSGWFTPWVMDHEQLAQGSCL